MNHVYIKVPNKEITYFCKMKKTISCCTYKYTWILINMSLHNLSQTYTALLDRAVEYTYSTLAKR